MGTAPAERHWAAVLFVFSALVGLLLQTRGALLPSFQTSFGATEAQLGLLASLAAAASFLTVLAVGLRAGTLRANRVLLVAFVATAASLAALWWVQTFSLLAVGLVAAAGAVGAARALDRPVLSHLFPASRPRMFSLYEMSWAVGATLGPLLATATVLVGEWRLTYVVLAVGFAGLAVAVVRLDAPATVDSERPFVLSSLPELLSQPPVRAMVLAIAFSVAVEAGIFTWLPFYATGFLGRETATVLLSVYLVAYVPGRFTASRVVDRVGPRRVLLASAAGTAVTLVALLSVRTTLPTLAASFALGFVVSAVYPTVHAWATGSQPDVSGPINALASAAGTLAAFVSPALVGFVADASDIALAMWLLPGFACGLLLVALVVHTGVSPSV
jgi:fucose permease